MGSVFGKKGTADSKKLFGFSFEFCREYFLRNTNCHELAMNYASTTSN
jgi:hypothetical protein